MSDVIKAVVLLSGGQDSTTCLYQAIKDLSNVAKPARKLYEVHALSFDYGQKHVIELDRAAKIAKDAGCASHKVINLAGAMAPSALTDHSIDVNAAHAQNSELPATFTAGRNAIFLAFAMSYAYTIGATAVYTGVCETDYSGYPDCRLDFIAAQEKALNLALGFNDEHSNYIDIYTPLMSLDKAETWKLAKDLGILKIIINDTLTDYNGSEIFNEWGYGTADNPATLLRMAGYYKAKAHGWI